MPIAGHLDTRCIDPQGGKYFNKFVESQCRLETLAKKLLRAWVFMTSMKFDQALDLLVALGTSQIANE
jgi:hypothetical protein